MEVSEEADHALSLRGFLSLLRNTVTDVAKGAHNLLLRGDRKEVVLVRSPPPNAGVAPHDGASALQWDHEALCF